MQPHLWPTLLALAAPAAPGSLGPGTDGLGGPPPGAWAPLMLLGLPLVVAIILIWMYVRTARQHRLAQLAPPVWLLPYLERQAGAGVAVQAPAPDADHVALEEMRLESTARLARRKRALLVGLGLNFVAGWAGAAVYLYAANREVEFEELPPSTTLAATLDTLEFLGLEGPGEVPADSAATLAPEVPVDTAALRLRRERLARRRDSLLEVARLDSIAVAEAVAQRVRDSVSQAIRDSIARAEAAARAVVVPAPPPPPAPRPAVPDPAVVRQRAGVVLAGGATALVQAINSREGLGALLGEGPDQQRFARFVEEYRPSAELQQVAETQVAAATATALADLRLSWRGAFGDNRSTAGRFRLEAVQAGESWRLARIVPLQTFP